MGRNPDTEIKVDSAYQIGWQDGWYDCKKKVLQLLKEGELSYNEIFCSEEAIEEVEKL